MTKKQKKPLTKQKKTLNAVLVFGMILMAGFMLYDAFAPTPSQPANPLDDVAFEGVEANPNDVTIEASQPAPVFDVEAKTTESQSETTALEVSLPSRKLVNEVVAPTQYELALSPDVEAALNDLKSEYFSQIKTKANHAKIAELESEKSLNALRFPPVPVASTTVNKSQLDVTALVQALTLRSIVFNPTQKTAWFELSGELIPVKERAWIEDIRVYKISKTTVVLINKNGKTYTKYMPNQVTVEEVVEDES